MAAVICVIFLIFEPLTLLAQPGPPLPTEGVGIDQNLGDTIPKDLLFTDAQGQQVNLGQYFDGRKPVILTLVYYQCPMLCTLVLNDLLRAMRSMEMTIGQDFDVLTVSFDPGETPSVAKAKKQRYLQQYDRPNATQGWHFLTGEPEAIDKLTDVVGFRYKYNQERGQYVHPSGLIILTPDGRIARYFFGVNYKPKDLRLALVEASDRQVGTVTDQVLLYCFQYDPSTGKYSLAVLNTVRAGGVVIMVALFTLVLALFKRERRKRAATDGPQSEVDEFMEDDA